MKAQVKELRVKIDGIAQLVKVLEKNPLVAIDLTNISDDAIQAFVQRVDQVHHIMKNRDLIHPEHIKNCHQSLLLAKAWLGKVLGELGEETPYKNDGKRRKVEDIEEPADMAKNMTDFPVAPDGWDDDISNVPHIEKIDFLRQEIKEVIEQIHELRMQTLGYSYDTNVFLANNYLTEARFHLGFELERIKKLNDVNN